MFSIFNLMFCAFFIYNQVKIVWKKLCLYTNFDIFKKYFWQTINIRFLLMIYRPMLLHKSKIPVISFLNTPRYEICEKLRNILFHQNRFTLTLFLNRNSMCYLKLLSRYSIYKSENLLFIIPYNLYLEGKFEFKSRFSNSS